MIFLFFSLTFACQNGRIGFNLEKEFPTPKQLTPLLFNATGSEEAKVRANLTDALFHLLPNNYVYLFTRQEYTAGTFTISISPDPHIRAGFMLTADENNSISWDVSKSSAVAMFVKKSKPTEMETTPTDEPLTIDWASNEIVFKMGDRIIQRILNHGFNSSAILQLYAISENRPSKAWFSHLEILNCSE